jgi:hypothetical protein
MALTLNLHAYSCHGQSTIHVAVHGRANDHTDATRSGPLSKREATASKLQDKITIGTSVCNKTRQDTASKDYILYKRLYSMIIFAILISYVARVDYIYAYSDGYSKTLVGTFH